MRATMFWTVLFGCVVIAACEANDSPDSGCDSVRADELSLSGSTLFNGAEPSTYLTGTIRTFVWDTAVHNMCVAAPESGNKVVFDVQADSAPASMVLQGLVYTSGLLQPSTVMLTPSATTTGHWSGVVTGIGLAQTSTDNIHGSVFPEVKVSFTTTGSLTSDNALVRSFLQHITMTVYYQSKS